MTASCHGAGMRLVWGCMLPPKLCGDSLMDQIPPYLVQGVVPVLMPLRLGIDSIAGVCPSTVVLKAPPKHV